MRLWTLNDMMRFCDAQKFKLINHTDNLGYRWDKSSPKNEIGEVENQVLFFLPGKVRLTNMLLYSTSNKSFYSSFISHYRDYGFEHEKQLIDNSGLPVEVYIRHKSNNDYVRLKVTAREYAGEPLYSFLLRDYVDDINEQFSRKFAISPSISGDYKIISGSECNIDKGAIIIGAIKDGIFEFSISVSNRSGYSGSINGSALFSDSDNADYVDMENKTQCQLHFHFKDEKLEIKEDGDCSYYFGSGICFNGIYVRNKSMPTQNKLQKNRSHFTK